MTLLWLLLACSGMDETALDEAPLEGPTHDALPPPPMDAQVPPGVGPPPLGHGVMPDGPPPQGGIGAPAEMHPSAHQLRTLLDAGRRGDEAAFEQAEALVDGLLESDPDDARVPAMKGWLLVERAHAAIDAMRAGDTFAPGADTWLEKAVAMDRELASAWRDLATWYELNDRPADALRCDQELLALNPADYGTRAHLGKTLSALGQPEDAETQLRLALEEWERQHGGGPVGDVQLLAKLGIYEQLGLVLMRLGRDAEAETVLLEAVAVVDETDDLEGPDEIIACPFVALGALYKKTGQDARGAGVLRRAADLEPYKATLQVDAALASQLAGDLAEAKTYIERAAKISTTPHVQQLREEIARGELSADTTLGGAVRAFERYDFGLAAQLVDGALGKAPDHGPSHVVRALLHTLDVDYAAAKASLERADNAEGAAVVRGHLALGDKDYAGAASAFDAAREPDFERIEGQDPSGYSWLVARMLWTGQAWALANQARHTEALPWFDKVLEQKPGDVFALIGKANSQNALGQLEAAEALLERVLEADPDNPYALAELALVKLNRGDEAAAEATFQKALDVEPETYTCPHEGLGLVYLRQGKVDAAKQSFEKAIEINPSIEYKKFNELARIYMSEGRWDDAARLLEQSIANHPYDDEAKALLAEVEAKR